MGSKGKDGERMATRHRVQLASRRLGLLGSRFPRGPGHRGYSAASSGQHRRRPESRSVQSGGKTAFLSKPEDGGETPRRTCDAATVAVAVANSHGLRRHSTAASFNSVSSTPRARDLILPHACSRNSASSSYLLPGVCDCGGPPSPCRGRRSPVGRASRLDLTP